MLLKLECFSVIQLKLNLTFDDDSTKEVVIGEGDIIDLTYNKYGTRTRIQGKVASITTNSTKASNWNIYIDGSDDFTSQTAKITANTILDCDIITKYSASTCVTSPAGEVNVMSVRVVDGVFQYTTNGVDWKAVGGTATGGNGGSTTPVIDGDDPVDDEIGDDDNTSGGQESGNTDSQGNQGSDSGSGSNGPATDEGVDFDF